MFQVQLYIFYKLIIYSIFLFFAAFCLEASYDAGAAQYRWVCAHYSVMSVIVDLNKLTYKGGTVYVTKVKMSKTDIELH